MLNVAIVGCGKIADSHVEQLMRVRGCRVIAAVDREPLMARQLCERFGIPHAFTDVSALLTSLRPDVVHITTPPQSHFMLARQCIDGGAHVYVEKPFTMNTAEAVELLGFAHNQSRKITVGHDLQFSPASIRARELVRSGYLGGDTVHIESYYCYELGNVAYAKAFLSNNHHWLRSLPGKLLQNVISHGIARIAELFRTETPIVIAHGFVSPLLKALGEGDIIDEVRVIVSDNSTTAYFTFSSQMKPSLNLFRVFGHTNGFAVDETQQTLIRLPGMALKSYAERFVSPLRLATEQARNVWLNGIKFIRGDFHMKAGMKTLIESFYKSIRDNTEPPIPYREIILTSRIMDEIFLQVAPPASLNAGQEISVDRQVPARTVPSSLAVAL